MKISVLEENVYDLFAEMDPFYFLERAKLPGYLCLGAAEEGKPYDKPAGLMVLRMEEDALIAEWIFIKGGFRMEGMGRALMTQAFSMARQAGLPELKVYVNNEYGRSDVCQYQAAFLEEYGFVSEQELPGEWQTDVESLIKLPVFEDAEDVLPETKSLASLTSAERMKVLKDLSENEKAALLFSPEEGDGAYDLQVSQISRMGSSLTGALLLKDIESSLYVCGLLARNKTELEALVWGALLAASEKFGGNKPVRVIRYTEAYKQQLRELLKEEPSKNSVYSASVRDFFNGLRKAQQLKETMPLISEEF